MTDIHPLLIERYAQGDLFEEDRIAIEWVYYDEGEVEFESYDFTTDQLKTLRNWLEIHIEPQRGYYGSYFFDGEDLWGYDAPNDEDDEQ